MSYREEDIAHVMSVTDFKDRETAIAALKTLDWLEGGALHSIEGLQGTVYFRMSQFVSRDATECKTNCCIAGAIELFRNEQFKSMLNTKILNTSLHWSEIDKRFNISRDDMEYSELNKLFFGITNECSHLRLNHIYTSHAAKVFRNYLFTGKTDWDLKDQVN